MRLRTLLGLQGVFAALAVTILAAGEWYSQPTGALLAAMSVVPSIVMFLICAGWPLLAADSRIKMNVGTFIAALAAGPVGIILFQPAQAVGSERTALPALNR